MNEVGDHRGVELGEPFVRVANALAAIDTPCWFVGGSIRDQMLGLPVTDIDLAVEGDAKAVAKEIHNKLGGDIFSLSDRFGTWRVNLADRELQVDITALRGTTIDEDLALRDFTINAMAIALFDRAALLDPFDGRADLDRKCIRVLGERAYVDDPLRPLRLVRFASSFDFTADSQTLELTRSFASGVAKASPERIFAELKSMVDGDRPIAGLRMLDDIGLL
ncbi:MAG: hypothetical protein ACPHCI_07580, partial [Solirubrobacterales bacterium]